MKIREALSSAFSYVGRYCFKCALFLRSTKQDSDDDFDFGEYNESDDAESCNSLEPLDRADHILGNNQIYKLWEKGLVKLEADEIKEAYKTQKNIMKSKYSAAYKFFREHELISQLAGIGE